MKIITAAEHAAWAEQNPDAGTRVLELANDADPAAVVFDGIDRIDLHFPKFTDGRAFSQAFLLRRRMGFRGELRATGDVLIDQLVQMARTGFDVAVLREGVDIADARRQFERFGGFYQGDAVHALPHFKAPAPRPLPVELPAGQAASA